MNEGNECPNMQYDDTSKVMENPVLLEPNMNTETTFANRLDEQRYVLNVGSNDWQRQVKYQSQKNGIAGKEYIEFKMINEKLFKMFQKKKEQ